MINLHADVVDDDLLQRPNHDDYGTDEESYRETKKHAVERPPSRPRGMRPNVLLTSNRDKYLYIFTSGDASMSPHTNQSLVMLSCPVFGLQNDHVVASTNKRDELVEY